MKSVLLICLLAGVFAAGRPDHRTDTKRTTAIFATCKGDTPCKACKNCKYCKRCAKNGLSCGICKK